ncbi:MAG: WG repeat-containing protein, partial [Flavobacteriales bacterium]|nr:WG repeat-containing protein [Flavobacteriales bacterium]
MATGDGAGAIDANGAERVPFLYSKVVPVSKDLVSVEKDGRLAYFKPSASKFIWKEEGFDALSAAPYQRSSGHARKRRSCCTP